MKMLGKLLTAFATQWWFCERSKSLPPNQVWARETIITNIMPTHIIVSETERRIRIHTSIYYVSVFVFLFVFIPRRMAVILFVANGNYKEFQWQDFSYFKSPTLWPPPQPTPTPCCVMFCCVMFFVSCVVCHPAIAAVDDFVQSGWIS